MNMPIGEANPLIVNNDARQLDLLDRHLFSSFALSSVAIDRKQVTPKLSQRSKNHCDRIDPFAYSYYAQLDKPKNSPSDKSKYNLFNPTSRNVWRDFVTDRPDKTTNPLTIDAVRFAIEADLFVYTKGIDRPKLFTNKEQGLLDATHPQLLIINYQLI